MTALGLPWLNHRLRGPEGRNSYKSELVTRPAFALRATFPISALRPIRGGEQEKQHRHIENRPTNNCK